MEDKERPQSESEEEASASEAQSAQLGGDDNPGETTDNDPPIIVQGG